MVFRAQFGTKSPSEDLSLPLWYEYKLPLFDFEEEQDHSLQDQGSLSYQLSLQDPSFQDQALFPLLRSQSPCSYQLKNQDISFQDSLRNEGKLFPSIIEESEDTWRLWGTKERKAPET
ncbi:hypothetical protein PSTG_17903 [Puccinia striiformis f. sp. tritici PST-78]|uniref:Uncharacterized protein n=1 Tax=Puccinia striiformis f. sp. tritici PST-78 TaxID=1165861 RepID=A0A0L0UNY5_9BASI|nr:hypothetical protein PSTG_17903 [Puccinia striiformis f. sp. tritici PST-78]